MSVETYSLYASDEVRKYFVVEMSTQEKLEKETYLFIYDCGLFIQLHVTVTLNGHISNGNLRKGHKYKYYR